MFAQNRVGLVVPSLESSGGVGVIAKSLYDCIQQSAEFDAKVISLATAVRDPSSVLLTNPGTWRRGARVRQGIWNGVPYSHVGAIFAELEFQRYRPRPVLTEALSDCGLIQVVSGCPAWALPFIGLAKPVVLQVATRAIVERRRRESVEHGPVALWRWGMTRITDRLDNRALRAVDAVLVENAWMFEYATDVCADHETLVHRGPPGVDVEFFHPAEERLAKTSSPGYVLSVGRFDDPRKNVELLLEAYAVLRETVSHAPDLKLVGSGAPGAKFWTRVQSLGLKDTVSFHPGVSRDELVRYYQEALCFVLSSDEEGFGMVIVEAMASGIPVVATRCGGPDGIVTEGIDGFLVPVGDPTLMSRRMVQLAQDRDGNREMGIAARRTAVARFDQKTTCGVFLDTYRTLLARRANLGVA